MQTTVVLVNKETSRQVGNLCGGMIDQNYSASGQGNFWFYWMNSIHVLTIFIVKTSKAQNILEPYMTQYTVINKGNEESSSKK